MDIIGDKEDLIGAELIKASEDTSDASDEADESGTWTFYNFITSKGAVTIRWLGQSNGYYSESVDFFEFKGRH